MPSAKFLERVSGPAADEVGDWLRDRVAPTRRRNVERIAMRAEELSREREQKAGTIPLHTLLPLLENSANEDEPEMQEHWAALLATAATAPAAVHPSLVRILAQLTAFDAHLLSELPRLEAETSMDGQNDPLAPRSWRPWGIARRAILASLASSDMAEFELAISATHALGLVELHGEHVRLTLLGRSLVMAFRV